MPTGGLRERKKARTRQLIADTAARLFGEHGYENVTVADVATAAEVAQQTLYNYFPTKEHLVLDRAEQLQARFVALIRNRDPGTSPAVALREEAVSLAESIRDLPPEALHGTLGYLATTSPTIRRLSLEMTDRLADALAIAIRETDPDTAPAVAKVQAIALAWLSQTVIDEGGRRIRDGRPTAQIANELRQIITTIADDLDTWTTKPAPPHSEATTRTSPHNSTAPIAER